MSEEGAKPLDDALAQVVMALESGEPEDSRICDLFAKLPLKQRLQFAKCVGCTVAANDFIEQIRGTGRLEVYTDCFVVDAVMHERMPDDWVPAPNITAANQNQKTGNRAAN